jgi:apolipoprotein N-acyltransferase
MAGLGQSQYRWIELIQISDLAGDFALDFLVMLVAACLGRMLPWQNARRSLWPAIPAIVAVAAALIYGYVRLGQESTEAGARIALVQGSIDTELKFDPSREAEVHRHYIDLSRKALARFPKVDLLVWPETMYREPLVSFVPGARRPSDWKGTSAELERTLKRVAGDSLEAMTSLARRFGVSMILGVDRVHYGADRVHRYNSAVFMDAAGNVISQYDKVHPVVFGEYVPLVDTFPWLSHFTPLSVSLDAGQSTACFPLGSIRLAPNICYETVLSHVIRGQVNRLTQAGKEPDVLVNLTNDGWFWGSSELDLHLMCGVFRAIECRKPLLVAANTGFSAWIDASGRILLRGPRREADTLLAEVRRDHRFSCYLRYGDVPAGLCLAACLLLAMADLTARYLARKRLRSNEL